MMDAELIYLIDLNNEEKTLKYCSKDEKCQME